VDARLRPAEKAAELAGPLTQAPMDAAQVRALSDYLVLLDSLEQQPGQDRPGLLQAADPMTRWIGAMQAGDEQRPAALALARREAQAAPAGSPAAVLWLAALVAQAQPRPAALQLSEAERRAAEAVPASSPLYLHLRYHLLRLQIEGGQAAAADAEVSRLLAHPPQPMDTATRNRWLALKLVTAPTLEAFLAAAPRQVAETGAGTPIARSDAASAAPAASTPAAPVMGLDEDFPRRLYRALPLSVLKTLPTRPDLPAAVKTGLIEALWTRAVLLGDWATADTWAPTLAQGRGTTAHLYTRFVQATTPEAKRLAATVIFVNTPELHPHRVDPQGNDTEWGCQGWGTGAQDALALTPPAFLSPAQQAEARREQAVLDALPNRNAYLAPTLLAWAQGKPADPEAPKALHFFVASTRNECRPPVPANGQPAPSPPTRARPSACCTSSGPTATGPARPSTTTAGAEPQRAGAGASASGSAPPVTAGAGWARAGAADATHAPGSAADPPGPPPRTRPGCAPRAPGPAPQADRPADGPRRRRWP
jgi:hypothetical protein